MAKKAMINKQQRPQKFKVREYTRCERCGRPHSVLRKYKLCRICFRELAYKGQIPGVKKASWEGGILNMIMTDPIADMLTRIRNALQQKHETVSMPVSKEKKAMNIRPGVYQIKLTADGKRGLLEILVQSGNEGNIRPEEVAYGLMSAGMPPVQQVVRIHRQGLYLLNQAGALVTPLDVV